jgi:Rieske Fe-S protein
MTDAHQTMTDPAPAALGRRVVLLGAGAVGVAGVLAACGGGDDGTASTGDKPTTGGGAEETAEATESSPAESSEPPAGSGAAGVVAVADVPVGGGVIVTAEQIVVTQPADGEFKAFGSTCTHQSCQVNEVADGQIICPCHGSRYSIEDGSVQGGPAPEPLPEVGVAVEGDQVVLT